MVKAAAISMEAGSALGLADSITKTTMKLQCLKVDLANKRIKS